VQLAGQEMARRGLAAALLGIEEQAVGEAAARTVGSVQLALLSGLITQWLGDAQRAPSGQDMAEGLRTILASVQTPGTTPAAEAAPPVEAAGDERA
jgi:hypothetical protein